MSEKELIAKVSRYALPAMPADKLPPLEERLRVVKSVGEECQKPDELQKILELNPSPVAYDGFEPSGRMHIAQGVLKKINVDKLTSAGFTYLFWVADWFALLNHKMGGDLAKIQTVGQYFIEVWKACGMNMERVKFLWASEEIGSRGDDYWGSVLDVSTKFSLTRVKRCCTIMGREDTDGLSSSQILYPCMQCTDVFFMEVDVCQLGVDQRKVNMLAREYAQKRKKDVKRPVILSHHMLLGLKQGQEKMSKSDPDSAIFMEDTREDIARKINKAYCPPREVYQTQKVYLNPILDHFNVVFKRFGAFSLPRKDGEPLTFNNANDLEKAFVAKEVTLEDLRTVLAEELIKVVAPVRDQLLPVLELSKNKQEFLLDANLIALKKGQDNGNATDPDNVILLTDNDDDIRRKVAKAYVPPKISYEMKKAINPCMDYFKSLVFESFDSVTITRPEEYGGDVTFTSYDEFERQYVDGVLAPQDIKGSLVDYIDRLVAPVRRHFEENVEAKELLEKVKKYRVTK